MNNALLVGVLHGEADLGEQIPRRWGVLSWASSQWSVIRTPRTELP